MEEHNRVWIHLTVMARKRYLEDVYAAVIAMSKVFEAQKIIAYAEQDEWK
jgi:hypothetical protein